MPASQHPRRRGSAEAVDQADGERQERRDCVSRNEPGEQGCDHDHDRTDQGAGPIACSAHARTGSCRCRPQDRVRLPSAGRGARRWQHTPTGRRRQRPQRRPVQIAMPMQPRFPVNDRTRGTATTETPGSIPAGFSRSVPPIQAGVGVVRLKPAGERAPQGSVLVQSNGRQGHGNRSSIRQPK